jgi:inward rectifier potassium channel
MTGHDKERNVPRSERHSSPRRHRLRGDGTMRIRAGAFEVRKKGASRYDWRDPYHFVMALSWPHFALLYVLTNLTLNLFFAVLYALQPGSVANVGPRAFGDLFFFSMETLATVGYGEFSPATFYGHVIAGAEIITGVAFTALVTGLIFVRFARPRAKILFAEQAVVANYNGRPTLMIRIGNGRANMLTDARAKLTAVIGEHTREGQFYRRAHDLPLVRPHFATFALTWTLMHPIDETSPLAGYDAHSFATRDIRLFLSVSGYDLTLGAEVRDSKDYAKESVVFGMRYADAVSIDEQGRTIADLNRLSLTEPDEGTSFEEGAARVAAE